MLKRICTTTPTFVRGTMALTRPRVGSTDPRRLRGSRTESADRSASHRQRSSQDIPLDQGSSKPVGHPRPYVAADLDQLTDVPALLLWGPSDPVFSDLYLLGSCCAVAQRPTSTGSSVPAISHPKTPMLHGAVYRLAGSTREPDTAGSSAEQERDPLWVRDPSEGPVTTPLPSSEMRAKMGKRRRSHSEQLDADVNRRVAAGLADLGVARGSRVALLIQPGIDLAVCLYASYADRRRGRLG